MDFSFDEDQEAVRELARQIFADHAEHERLRSIEESADGIDKELWAALGKVNLLGLALPEAHAGSDMGMTELAMLLEEQGRSLAQVPILASVVLGGLPVAAFGSDAQKSRLLPGVVTGETILSAALGEYASFDPARPRVTARPDGNDWRLDGEKICVPVAHLADRILVPARTGDDSIGVFLLDPHAEGVEIERQKMTNHEPQAQLLLTRARASADDVLGDPEAGEAIVRFMEARAMLGVSATMLGVADEALRRTAEYTGVRKQFEKAIGAFQGVSLRAADAYIDVEAMRSTLWEALWKLDEGRPADLEIGVAKWWSCYGGHRVVHTAQHLHGGTGADTDYPIHRFLLWFKQLELTLGGAAPQLARIGALVAQGAGQPG
jgi:alkylation response protein AidB-like acyl-CoA dehydrogenase